MADATEFRTHVRSGEQGEQRVAETGKGNQGEQEFTCKHMQRGHQQRRTDLMVGQNAGDERQDDEDKGKPVLRASDTLDVGESKAAVSENRATCDNHEADDVTGLCGQARNLDTEGGIPENHMCAQEYGNQQEAIWNRKVATVINGSAFQP